MSDDTTDLRLRRTVIGGETAPDDYVVVWDDLIIGRIFRTTGTAGSEAWSWSVALPNVPQPSHHRGRATTLAAAKAAFRVAWADLQGQVSYQQIRAAREIQNQTRAWHK